MSLSSPLSFSVRESLQLLEYPFALSDLSGYESSSLLRSCCLFLLLGSGCSEHFLGIEGAVNRLDRALCRADTTADTLNLVNGVFLLLLTGRCFNRTYLGAYLAPYAVVHDDCLRTRRNEIDNCLCRAFLNAEAADLALINIDLREVVPD